MSGARATARASWIERPVAAALVLLVLAAMVFTLRLMGPNDLMDKDQERPASYVADLLVNNQWIVQVDITGDVTSKPPVYTWLVALCVLADGAFDRLTLYLPCGLAMLVGAWLILGFGARVWGMRAALLGAAFYVVSVPTITMATLARTDPVFAASVGVAAMLAWHAWQSGRGWTWFWLAASVATLTKGPLGLVLPAFGLIAAAWEWRSGHGARLRGNHLVGVLLYFAVCLGWLFAAYAVLGDAVFEKLLGRELVQHAVASDSGKDLPFTKFYEPPLVFVARFAPWSLLAIAALWRVFRAPAADDTERRFERFLACFFLAGLALFAAAPHQRNVHQLPLMIAPALLAGREAARWMTTRGWSTAPVVAALAGLLAIGLPIYNVVRLHGGKVWETRYSTLIAERLVEKYGSLYAVTIIDAPSTMQFATGTFQRRVSFEQAAEAIKAGTPMILATRRLEKLDELLPADRKPLREIASWPNESDERWLRIVTNTPNAEAELAAARATLERVGPPRVLATRPNLARRVAVLLLLGGALVATGVWLGRRLERTA